MRKRIFAVVMTILLTFSMILPVSAEDSQLYIIDQTNVITDLIPELNAKASTVSDACGMNVSYLMAGSTGDLGSADYAEQVYESCYGDADGIMLIDSSENKEWYLYKSGNAQDLLSEEDEDTLWAAYNSCDYYGEAIEAYLDKAQELLGATAPAEAEADSNTIPEERLLPRLVDNGELLSDEEEQELLEELDEISERQSCDVVVVTTGSLDGKTPQDYADDFYDYNGYGMGEDRDGVLLLVSMEDRDWWISTCGYGITVFSDSDIEYMGEQFTPMLSDGDYAGAFDRYAGLCDNFITRTRNNEAEAVSEEEEGWHFDPAEAEGALIIGLVIAFFIARKKKAALKSVKVQAFAGDYIVPGSMHVMVKRDRFVNKVVTTRTIDRDTSTHTSSSGTTHGGSGGKF